MADTKLVRPEKIDFLLFNTLEKIISYHHINDTTVSEIVSKANIHRSTFYIHFSDKYELARAYILRSLDDMNAVLCDMLSESHEKRFQTATRFFALLKANQKKVDMILQHIGEDIFNECMEKEMHGLFVNLTGIDSVPPEYDKEMFIQFVTGALVGVTKWWIKNGMRTPPDEVAKFYCELYKNISKSQA